MNNLTSFFGTRGKILRVILCAAFAALAFIACSDSGPTTVDPVVTGVTVSPSSKNIALDGTRTFTFTANVSGTGDYSKEVTWEIVETTVKAGTTIDNTGLLTVDPAETVNSSFSVRATSTADTAKSGTATVNIYSSASSMPNVTSVTINPTNPSVIKGGNVQFSAFVAGTNLSSTGVIWSIIEGGALSSIDQHGELTVASNEAGNSLKVQAAAIADGEITDTVTVTLTTPVAPSSDFNGTWTGDLTNMGMVGISGPGEWVMSNGNFTMNSRSGSSHQGLFQGTYKTAGGDTLMSTFTAINGYLLNQMMAEEFEEGEEPPFSFDNRFYTFTQIETTVIQELVNLGMTQQEAQELMAEGFASFADMTEPQMFRYSFNSIRTELTINMGDNRNLVLTKEGGATPGNLAGTWALDTSGMGEGEIPADMSGFVGELKLTGSNSGGTLEAFVDTGRTTVPMMRGNYSTNSGNFTATATDVNGSGINFIFTTMMAQEGSEGGEGGMFEDIPDDVINDLLLTEGTWYSPASLETAIKDRMRMVFTMMAQQEQGQNPSSSEINEMVNQTYAEDVAPVLAQVFEPHTTAYEVTNTLLVFSGIVVDNESLEDVVFIRQ